MGAVDMLLPVVAAGVTVAAPGAVFASVDAVAAFGSVRALLMIPVLAIQLSFGGFTSGKMILMMPERVAPIEAHCPQSSEA